MSVLQKGYRQFFFFYNLSFCSVEVLFGLFFIYLMFACWFVCTMDI